MVAIIISLPLLSPLHSTDYIHWKVLNGLYIMNSISHLYSWSMYFHHACTLSSITHRAYKYIFVCYCMVRHTTSPWCVVLHICHLTDHLAFRQPMDQCWHHTADRPSNANQSYLQAEAALSPGPANMQYQEPCSKMVYIYHIQSGKQPLLQELMGVKWEVENGQNIKWEVGNGLKSNWEVGNEI